MKKIVLPISVVCCMLASCSKAKNETIVPEKQQTKSYPSLEKANWLIGNWGNASSEGVLTEFWKKTNDSVYHGESYFVVKSDTVFSENIELEETNGKLAYVVTVPGQNNEKPVRFEMTSIAGDSIIFENPQHDYPNKISYKKITNDSLVAKIAGIQNGKPTSETFTMKRQK
ncbi:hypothetical protein GR160_03335 [Flavobacterium sp. Sd200]|uniref:DUF6265 family protein n=1 Tax=Flavobacterium sp. Sd200 TaxID=2692211 RepID=UPI00136B6229|nr:DUF6265 family protein [Flavobacterium sp. Sd200]MXN90249.1 hypothetical protein [Flavobacterium sp. Sd200]